MLRTVLAGKRSAAHPHGDLSASRSRSRPSDGGSVGCAGEDEPDDTQTTSGIEAGAGPADPDMAGVRISADLI